MAEERSENEPLSVCAGASTGSIASLECSDPGSRLEPRQLGWLMEHGRGALAYLNTRGEVRVRIVGDDEMAIAHERYSGVPGTTDVLTFDLRSEDQILKDLHTLDVDILVCVDEARRQAAARGHDPERELLLYIVHGVLHCLGHDDHEEQAFDRMHLLEDRVLSAIGVGAVFSVGGATSNGGLNP